MVPYFKTLTDEFSSLGFEVDIQQREKVVSTAIVSAFLKNNSSVYDLQVQGRKTLKIKFEVDTNPPMLFSTEEKLLLQPYSFYTKCFSLPDLFAGKMHALLFRNWKTRVKTRVKGRDWFDFEWYVRQNTALNLSHFCERARQSGDLKGDNLKPGQFLELLSVRIAGLDVNSARDDVRRYIRTPEQLDIWSQKYFMDLARRVRFKTSALEQAER